MIAQTPLLHAIKAYGHLLERDFNLLAKLLLLQSPALFGFFSANSKLIYP
ncbi:hypothetical protein METHB2_20137 [Candidatus Methylobacter favarea]|uniref:Uncharacterized protein n=1 Tax=Candidatus Methylobacter favarea TaxID=2707345 RepID=A0A8S0W9X7_9GAMM|nr:hypothetical protein METHB2_20137 [Candidatus Methylobacter favarea]